jgi:hypothetical protein
MKDDEKNTKLEEENAILKKKISKLKRLLLLVDPCVIMFVPDVVQIEQWNEYLKSFPDEKTEKKYYGDIKVVEKNETKTN